MGGGKVTLSSEGVSERGGGIPKPEGGAVKWLALGQAIRHQTEEDKTILTTNWILI